MKHPKTTYLVQGLAALILASASLAKFSSHPASVFVFEALGMEPQGRYLIAVIEMTAALALISPYAAWGALLALAVMLGALIAHLSKLGIALGEDRGRAFMSLWVLLFCAVFILFQRRKEIPLIGDDDS